MRANSKLRIVRCPICSSDFDCKLPTLGDADERKIIRVECPVCKSKFEVVVWKSDSENRKDKK